MDVSASEAARLVQEGKAVLVDVREPGERRQAAIPGALHVPLGALRARLHELPGDRVLIFQCASGGRSASACHVARAAGREVRNLRGGIMAWHATGLPVARGS